MFSMRVEEYIANPSWMTYVFVFASGFLLSMGSCSAMRIPIVVGFFGGMPGCRRTLARSLAAFISGTVVTYVCYGIILGLMGSVTKHIIMASPYMYYLLGAILVGTGLSRLGFVHIPWDKVQARLTRSFIEPLFKKGIVGIFLLGVLITFFETPSCAYCGPLLFMLSALTVAKGSVVYGISLFLVYALGQSIIVAGAGFSAGFLRQVNKRMQHWEEFVGCVAGVILIFIGIFFLWIG